MPAETISPPRPYVKFVNESGELSLQGYDFLFGLYRRVGGSLSSLNAALLLDRTWAEPDPIGVVTPKAGTFTVLTGTQEFTTNGIFANAASLVINPLTGTMDKVIIGDSTPAKGTFSDLRVNPVTGLDVRLEPSGSIVFISGATVGTMDKFNIGVTTPGTGKFTTVQATTGFGCNGTSPQPSYSVGATLGSYVGGAAGLSTAAAMEALLNKVIAMEAALRANGILTT